MPPGTRQADGQRAARSRPKRAGVGWMPSRGCLCGVFASTHPHSTIATGLHLSLAPLLPRPCALPRSLAPPLPALLCALPARSCWPPLLQPACNNARFPSLPCPRSRSLAPSLSYALRLRLARSLWPALAPCVPLALPSLCSLAYKRKEAPPCEWSPLWLVFACDGLARLSTPVLGRT